MDIHGFHPIQFLSSPVLVRSGLVRSGSSPVQYQSSSGPVLVRSSLVPVWSNPVQVQSCFLVKSLSMMSIKLIKSSRSSKSANSSI